MVNKRFNFVGGYLYDGDDPVGHIEDIRFREDFLDLLNNLNEKARGSGKALSKLQKENEQLKKQIKIFDEFLDGNNLDIDWNELCILDSCMMNDEVECRDCIYIGMDVLE